MNNSLKPQEYLCYYYTGKKSIQFTYGKEYKFFIIDYTRAYVADDNKRIMIFILQKSDKELPYIADYFSTIEEFRQNKINRILNDKI